MVVDDSLTVRKITSRLLAREGYQVMTAKDGVDALEQLLDIVPDVLLVDIEMPRMDGFDLTRNVRADPPEGYSDHHDHLANADKHRNTPSRSVSITILASPIRKTSCCGW
jgi:chemosensory pili system protein ChpA (sensor histidine kinase/response regulator)